MRKNLIALVIILTIFLINITYSQIKIVYESDIQNKKIFEYYAEKNITSINIIRYDVDSGIVSTEFEKTSTVKINANNNTYTEITYLPNYSKTVITFNGQKNVTDVSIYYSNNALMSRVVTNYEPDNTIKNKVYYFGNALTFKTNNKYSSGNIVEQEYVDSLGKLSSYSKIYYDNSNRIIEEEKFNEVDSLEIVYKYAYDNAGNCIEEQINYPQANYSSKIFYKYDNKGNKIEKTVYGMGDKLISRNEYKYNDKSLLIKETAYSIDNKVTSESDYVYDDNGNKIEWRYKDYMEEFEYLYRYEYN